MAPLRHTLNLPGSPGKSKEMTQMTMMKRLVLALLVAAVLAPAIGLADDPIPTCNPCPPIEIGF